MQSKILIRTSALLAALSFAGVAHAHHAAGVGNSGTSGAVNTISAGTLDQGQWVAGISVEQNDFDALSDETLAGAAEDAANNGDPEAHFHSLDSIRTTSLTLSYGITHDLMLTARLPYVSRQDIREGHAHEHMPGVFEGSVHMNDDSEGWGDLSLIGQWRFLNDEAAHSQAALIFGVEAPTGETKVRNAEDEVFDAEFQPGSDSWDYYLGAAFSRGAMRWGFDASALYTFQSDGLDANIGDRFNYGAAVSYRVYGVPAHNDAPGDHHSHGPALDAVFELSGEWHGKQKEEDETDPDSGGHVLYAQPGLRFTNDAFSAFASVGVPVITDFNGLQAEPDLRVTLGAGLRF